MKINLLVKKLNFNPTKVPKVWATSFMQFANKSRTNLFSRESCSCSITDIPNKEAQGHIEVTNLFSQDKVEIVHDVFLEIFDSSIRDGLPIMFIK